MSVFHETMFYLVVLLNIQIPWLLREVTCLWVNVVCLFSWRYNPFWLHFHSPVAGFSLLIFEVS